jgi:digeranylgeranylglycerophospholipid reductase
MSEAARADVLVVGLGPAGASAAAVAARAGARVIAIDRKREAGLPVQCAEFVPMALGGESAVLEAKCQSITAMMTSVEDDTPDRTEDFCGRMVDRARFDAALVRRAEAAGADCRFSVALASLLARGIATLCDGSRIAARAIVGADGPRSRVGRAIGSLNAELVETRQITVPLTRAHEATEVFLSADIPGGYAWLFPKGDVANLGLGVLPECRARLKPLLEALRRRLIADGRIGEAILGTTGGAIPVGGMVNVCGELSGCAVLLAGDAAGLVNPVTGAGIPAAVISGRMAGEAAARLVAGDAGAAADYAVDLSDLFAASIARALGRRRGVLAKFGDRSAPLKSDLRGGWIAYPPYWAP